MSLQTEEVHIHTGKEEEKKKQQIDMRLRERERDRQRVIQVWAGWLVSMHAYCCHWLSRTLSVLVGVKVEGGLRLYIHVDMGVCAS